MGSDWRLHRWRCQRRHNSAFMLYGREGLGGSQIFGAVFVWPCAVLMESRRKFRTESGVRLVQVAKKFLLMTFVQEETVGLNAA